MRRALVTALFAGAALAAGAVPAFTANSGSVAATVSVPLPPAPCITLTATSVDFGTLEFSDPAAPSTPIRLATPIVRVASCSTADEYISVRGSEATTASGGVWSLPGPSPVNTCAAGSNRYIPYARDSLRDLRLTGSFQRLTSVSFRPGVGSSLSFGIKMPCRGSVGAGETASMTFSFLAVLA